MCLDSWYVAYNLIIWQSKCNQDIYWMYYFLGSELWTSWLWIRLLGNWYHHLCFIVWFISISGRFRCGNLFKYPKCSIWLWLWGKEKSFSIKFLLKFWDNIMFKISLIRYQLFLLFSGIWRNYRRSQKLYWILTFEAKTKTIISQRMLKPPMVG